MMIMNQLKFLFKVISYLKLFKALHNEGCTMMFLVKLKHNINKMSKNKFKTKFFNYFINLLFYLSNKQIK